MRKAEKQIEYGKYRWIGFSRNKIVTLKTFLTVRSAFVLSVPSPPCRIDSKTRDSSHSFITDSQHEDIDKMKTVKILFTRVIGLP